MVGGLVQQQNIGRWRERVGTRCAPGLTAREMRRVFISSEAKALDKRARPVHIVAGAKIAFNRRQNGGKAAQLRLLRQIAERRTGLDETLASVSLDRSGGDLQQGGFAAAIAPDQAQALALGNR